ncbi:hypothetical protein BSZ35_10405 [Salinibacter sp. 10B]|uniref:hypothetical protein n=1 Tax=Salinibacter sp. 10B TaxID=1923971 RepID=UPI000CF3AE64|nr:hypothetical protein [Salinibacter sp. 10B]PQJ34954.1 hypothetical protein BSZ35_10405 [Salinibacter sp. 10B]
MTLFARSILIAAVCVLTASPVWAQNTDTGGSIPQSDVSGSDVSGTLSDLDAFQTEAAQGRLVAVSSQLAQSVRSGVLATGDGTSVTVSPQMMDLVFVPTRAKRHAASQQLYDLLVGQGVPASEATAFTTALTGLLENETVQPTQLVTALQAFNSVVEIAPTAFLAQPPSDFIAARILLITLLDAATL